MASRAIAVFAKAPIAGWVKTRLTPTLSPAQAAEFHLACVRDTWLKTKDLPGVERYLYADQPWPEFEAMASKGRVRLQKGVDLGRRMSQCLLDLHAESHGRALIVGCDSPTLPPAYLTDAFSKLDEADVVLGPAEDGGYYAIGCRRLVPGALEGIEWSSSETLQQTESNLTRLGMRTIQLPLWYDIDTPEDLKRLAKESSLPPNVARWVAKHRGLVA